MEAVLGDATCRHGRHQGPEEAAGSAFEPLTQGRGECRRGHPVQELVAHPVGLDDPPIQWFADAVAGGDQLEVGPRPLEPGRHVPQALLLPSLRGSAEECVGVPGPQ